MKEAICNFSSSKLVSFEAGQQMRWARKKILCGAVPVGLQTRKPKARWPQNLSAASAMSLYRMNEPTAARLCKIRGLPPISAVFHPFFSGEHDSAAIQGQGSTPASSMRSRRLAWLGCWEQGISLNKKQQGSDCTKVSVVPVLCEIAVYGKYVNICMLFATLTYLAAIDGIVFSHWYVLSAGKGSANQNFHKFEGAGAPVLLYQL